MNNYKFTLYLGLNDKDTKQQKISTIDAYKIVSNIIAQRFDNGSIFEATGIYKHDNGVIDIETLLKIELQFVPFDTVKAFVDLLKEIFNQESVVVNKKEILNFNQDQQ